MRHPMHDIPVGHDPPKILNAVIEVPLGSTVKYELDEDLGMIRISHMLYPPVPYPGNYGFIPQTLDEDDDPLDMMVVMRTEVSPLSIATVRPIGLVDMHDEGEKDSKVLCVLVDDPVYSPYETFEELPEYERQEIEWFFEEYQKATHEEVEVEAVLGRDAAYESVERCMARYREVHEKH